MSDRGVRGAAYTVLTPANHYPCRLPNLPDADVVKLVTPRRAPARFAAYLVVLPPGGGTTDPVAPGFETFLYGLAGRLALEADGRVGITLDPGGFAYLPAPAGFELRGAPDAASRVLWLKRRYEPFPGLGSPEPRPATATTSRSTARRSRACAGASCSTQPIRDSTST